MKNEKEEKENEVIDLSKFDFSENSSEDQNRQPKSLGSFLSAINEGLFGFDSPKDRKKKIRNLTIIVVNFGLMFIILGYYFSSNKPNEENYENSMPAEMMEEEMMMEMDEEI